MPTTPQRAALAIFVKTPGASPIKTRLARAIGADRAEEFHRASCAAIQEVAIACHRSRGITPFWAVAEPEEVDNPCWIAFPTLTQGTGSLGARLSRVHATLGESHDIVLFCAADAPLLSPRHIDAACETIRSGAAFAISRSRDGGYALFASGRAIEHRIWTSIPYSSPETAGAFIAAIEGSGETVELEPVDDVDSLDDVRLLVEAARGRVLLPGQERVIDLARRILAEHPNSVDPG